MGAWRAIINELHPSAMPEVTPNMSSSRTTGFLFYSLIAAWVLGIGIGMAARLPYVQRPYAGVTLPCFCGISLLVLTVSNHCSGVIWRGQGRAIVRHAEPRTYWTLLTAMGLAGALLLSVGVRNWMRLP